MGGLSDTEEGIISRFLLLILKPLHKPLEKILLDPLVKKRAAWPDGLRRVLLNQANRLSPLWKSFLFDKDAAIIGWHIDRDELIWQAH